MEIPPLLIAKKDDSFYILPKMANRHGLITGATGTGKTTTLQNIAENFSAIGTPVFMADVKGDLAGLSEPSSVPDWIPAKLESLGLKEGFTFTGYPVTFWDVFGEMGHPVRTTVSEMGPLMLARLLDLNETQTGVLTMVFRIADDSGLLLLDLKDLRLMLQYVGDNAEEFTTEYGNVSPATIGTIQRGLLALEEQGGDIFFGEPAFKLKDLIKTSADGRGVINILHSAKLMHSPKVYSTFLLWLLAELFEQLPEVGDPDKPKLVFFFDEAHLLFNDVPKALLEKIEQVVRLVRSKGVGIYFISQNPMDIPESVLGQLGNRVQHALRAFTPTDQKAVRAAAQTFRTNPDLDVEKVITELELGEALISFLDKKGAPGVVQRAYIVPPHSHLGPISDEQRDRIIKNSEFFGVYEEVVDRESAYEILKKRATEEKAIEDAEKKAAEEAKLAKEQAKLDREAEREAEKEEKERERKRRESQRRAGKITREVISFAKSSTGKELVRGILGSLK